MNILINLVLKLFAVLFSLLFFLLSIFYTLWFASVLFQGSGSGALHQSIPWMSWLIFALILTFPTTSIYSAVITSRKLEKKEYKKAFLWSLLPLVSIGIIAIVFSVFS